MRTDAATNQRQLLDSAAQLLSEQGPQVSLRTIAKHAGSPPSTATSRPASPWRRRWFSTS